MAYPQLEVALRKLGTQLVELNKTFVPVLQAEYAKLKQTDPNAPGLEELRESLQFFGANPN